MEPNLDNDNEPSPREEVVGKSEEKDVADTDLAPKKEGLSDLQVPDEAFFREALMRTSRFQ